MCNTPKNFPGNISVPKRGTEWDNSRKDTFYSQVLVTDRDSSSIPGSRGNSEPPQSSKVAMPYPKSYKIKVNVLKVLIIQGFPVFLSLPMCILAIRSFKHGMCINFLLEIQNIFFQDLKPNSLVFLTNTKQTQNPAQKFTFVFIFVAFKLSPKNHPIFLSCS